MRRTTHPLITLYRLNKKVHHTNIRQLKNVDKDGKRSLGTIISRELTITPFILDAEQLNNEAKFE